jgi:hypothetical protein
MSRRIILTLEARPQRIDQGLIGQVHGCLERSTLENVGSLGNRPSHKVARQASLADPCFAPQDDSLRATLTRRVIQLDEFRELVRAPHERLVERGH